MAISKALTTRIPSIADASKAVLQIAGLAVLVSTTLVVSPTLGYGNEAYTVVKTLLLAIAAAIGLVTLAQQRHFRPTAVDALLALCFVHGLVSMRANGVQSSIASATLLPELCAGIVMAAIAAGTRGDAKRRALVLDAVVLAGTVMAAIALCEALGLSLPWAGARRPFSTLGNRNFVGAEAAIAAAIAVGRLLRNASLLRAASLLVLLTAVGVSRCRSAWLGLITAALIMSVIVLFSRRLSGPGSTVQGSPRGVRLAVLSAGLGLAAAAFVPWPGLHWTDSRAPIASTLARLTEYETGTGHERLGDFGIAATLAWDQPLFGVGPRGWDDAASSLAHQISDRHATPQHFWTTPNSDLARTLGERGMVGLALLLAASLALANEAQQALVRRADPETLGIIGALVILAINATLDAPLFRPSSLALSAITIGAVRARGSREFAVPRAVVLASSAVLGAILVLGTTLRVAAAATIAHNPHNVATIRRAQALFWRPDVAEVLSLRLSRDGSCEEAEAAGEAALAASPHHWGVPHALAACWHLRGDDIRSRHFLAERDRIEPHVAALFAENADLPSGYERAAAHP